MCLNLTTLNDCNDAGYNNDVKTCRNYKYKH